MILVIGSPSTCSRQSAADDISSSEWIQLIDNRSGPTAIYVWASWSRSSVELMPSMFELQQEYESLGVEFVYLSLDADSPEQAVALMAELEGPSFYRLTTPLEQAAALLGIHEPPAVLGFRPSTSEPLRLEPGLDGALVSPADVAALLEELLSEDL